jgi:copper resistance protein B
LRNRTGARTADACTRRDPDAWADGSEDTGMAGFQKIDPLPISLFLLGEFEFESGKEGDGGAWTLQAARGDDVVKLWLRSQRLKIAGQPLDPTFSAEVLLWRVYTSFCGLVLGMRQDPGAGARAWLTFGMEDLAPHWFALKATGYVAEDGRRAARLKGSCDLRFTNRLILTPALETNFHSRPDPERGLGSGPGNVEIGLRVRYVVHRKFAPCVGYVWGRSFGGTANLARASGEPVNEHRFVAGLRVWWPADGPANAAMRLRKKLEEG